MRIPGSSSRYLSPSPTHLPVPIGRPPVAPHSGVPTLDGEVYCSRSPRNTFTHRLFHCQPPNRPHYSWPLDAPSHRPEEALAIQARTNNLSSVSPSLISPAPPPRLSHSTSSPPSRPNHPRKASNQPPRYTTPAHPTHTTQERTLPQTSEQATPHPNTTRVETPPNGGSNTPPATTKKPHPQATPPPPGRQLTTTLLTTTLLTNTLPHVKERTTRRVEQHSTLGNQATPHNTTPSPTKTPHNSPANPREHHPPLPRKESKHHHSPPTPREKPRKHSPTTTHTPLSREPHPLPKETSPTHSTTGKQQEDEVETPTPQKSYATPPHQQRYPQRTETLLQEETKAKNTR